MIAHSTRPGPRSHSHTHILTQTTGNHEVGPFVAFDARKAAEQLTNATFLDNAVAEIGGVRFFGIPWKRQFSAKLPVGGVDVLFAHEPPEGILDGGYGCDVLLGLASGRNFNDDRDGGGGGASGGGAGGGGGGGSGGGSISSSSSSGAIDSGASRSVSATASSSVPCQVMLFGHIHETHGVVHDEERKVTFVNCAVANKGMRAESVEQPIFYFDIAPRCGGDAGCGAGGGVGVGAAGGVLDLAAAAPVDGNGDDDGKEDEASAAEAEGGERGEAAAAQTAGNGPREDNS